MKDHEMEIEMGYLGDSNWIFIDRGSRMKKSEHEDIS